MLDCADIRFRPFASHGKEGETVARTSCATRDTSECSASPVDPTSVLGASCRGTRGAMSTDRMKYTRSDDLPDGLPHSCCIAAATDSVAQSRVLVCGRPWQFPPSCSQNRCTKDRTTRMTNLIALKSGTELVGDFRICPRAGRWRFRHHVFGRRVGARPRGHHQKEYFPADFAVRGAGMEAVPRSENCAGDYTWGLDRFIDEAQTLARFNHPPTSCASIATSAPTRLPTWSSTSRKAISLKGWLKSLGRAPRKKNSTRSSALFSSHWKKKIHKADFLHRDIAPDDVIDPPDGRPCDRLQLRARQIAAHSKTVSAPRQARLQPLRRTPNPANARPRTTSTRFGATRYITPAPATPA